MNLNECIIRPLTRDELSVAVDWASAEGWNPGLQDADIFWKTDPEGFVGVECAGTIVATGSIVAYGAEFGFMGFFIVKPELRGQGIGSKLWFYRRDLLRSRLKDGAAIGMDGVFDMQAWYGKGGFAFSHRNLRMEGTAVEGVFNAALVPLEECAFEDIAAYDHQHFGCERTRFLEQWVRPKHGMALGYVSEGQLLGYGVLRKCLVGYKVGPLFANDCKIAEALFVGLSQSAIGEPIVLDVPENNAAALSLAESYGLKEVFGCARMYYGAAPELPWQQIFGITSFELG